MGVLDIIILAAVAVCFFAALRSIRKHKGGCGCCAGCKKAEGTAKNGCKGCSCQK